MRQMNPTWSPKVRMKDGLRLHLNPPVPERRLPVSCVMQDQCGRTERSKAHCICSQFFHSSANTDTPTQVSARWRRLRSSGAVNLAAVETHTRMTVTMASIMLMHFPSSTLASAFSSWTVCCCCCCCSSSLDTRVWHDSSISCSKKEFINILLLHNLIQIWEKNVDTILLLKEVCMWCVLILWATFPMSLCNRAPDKNEQKMLGHQELTENLRVNLLKLLAPAFTVVPGCCLNLF